MPPRIPRMFAELEVGRRSPHRAFCPASWRVCCLRDNASRNAADHVDKVLPSSIQGCNRQIVDAASRLLDRRNAIAFLNGSHLQKGRRCLLYPYLRPVVATADGRLNVCKKTGTTGGREFECRLRPAAGAAERLLARLQLRFTCLFAVAWGFQGMGRGPLPSGFEPQWT